MRIIHCCDSISVGGGIATFVNNLSIAQAVSHEVSVSVISSKESENRLIFPKHVGVIDFKKQEQGFSVRYPLKIFRFLCRNRYDVVHIHSSFLYYFLPVLFFHHKTKFIYTIHSDAVRENSSVWDKRFLALKRWCFKKKWILPVTISENSKRSFDDLYQLDSTMIINGIPLAEVYHTTHKLSNFRISEKTKLLLHVGRITEAKNQVMLCEAVSQLINQGNDLVLIIVGVNQDNKIYQSIKGYLGQRIHYIGERTDIIDLLKEADVMCLSSIWEGLPIVLLESLSVSCIPICTPVGGIPNVITDGFNGILALNTTVLEYKEAISRYLSLSESDVLKMKENAKASSYAYDIRQTASQYINLYKAD